jgi:hypothetical protein
MFGKAGSRMMARPSGPAQHSHFRAFCFLSEPAQYRSRFHNVPVPVTIHQKQPRVPNAAPTRSRVPAFSRSRTHTRPRTAQTRSAFPHPIGKPTTSPTTLRLRLRHSCRFESPRPVPSQNPSPNHHEGQGQRLQEG